jgi:putative salt-induced outer membrane protein YdiY
LTAAHRAKVFPPRDLIRWSPRPRFRLQYRLSRSTAPTAGLLHFQKRRAGRAAAHHDQDHAARDAAAQMLMKSFTKFALAFAAAHCVAATAAADDYGPEAINVHAPLTVMRPAQLPEGGWFTSAELGAITTSGNTTGTSVTGKIDARHETSNWSNEFIASGFFKEDQVTDADGDKHSQRSAQRYMLSAKAAFKLLGEGKRAFVLGSHVNDKFGAYTRYSSLSVGHGAQWYKTDDKTLDVEIGPGYFHGVRALDEAGVEEDESGFTIRGATQFRWAVSPSAQFVQTMSVERGTSNTHTIAETALSTKINSTMQMKAGFSARNDTNVPAGKKNTDTQTSLTMVYSF